ncbi:MAG: hypothetical protein ACOH1T_04690 [Microbacteriaceae bacterium]
MAFVPLEINPAQLLPGTWHVQATNFPIWLAGDRLDPRFTYSIASSEPLVIADNVTFDTPEGEEKHTFGTSKFDRGVFVWRAQGFFKLARTRWTIAGVSDDQNTVTIRFEGTRAAPSGIDVLIRDGLEQPELRSFVAHNSEQFGLSAEDFASLTWLRRNDPAPILGTA